MNLPVRPPLPSLFLSHGSPMLALEPGATGAFLSRLGPAIDAAFGRPHAILALSAHSTATRTPVLLAAQRQHAVHDFGGFPEALYHLGYEPPGAPQWAVRVSALLERAGIACSTSPQAGLDHGIWSLLRFLYPGAEIPVLPLAWLPPHPPAQQFALGEALAPLLAEGVLVMASGSITHNLRRVFAAETARGGLGATGTRGHLDPPEIAECREFRQWMAHRSAARDWPALLDYRRQAPHARDMHPTDEHLLPWFVAAGAGGAGPVPMRLFEGVTHGCLGMDAYAFGTGAAALQMALSEGPP